MTIYALSTGPGISGIEIIRVSGEDTKKVIELLTKTTIPETPGPVDKAYIVIQ